MSSAVDSGLPIRLAQNLPAQSAAGQLQGTKNSESSRLIDNILGRKSKPKENGSVVTETPQSQPDSALEQAQPQKTETTSSQPPSASTTSATNAPAAATTTTPAVVEPPAEKQGERGRGKEFESNTGRKIERSVSPGTLPDGRHAKTDGDRGLSYVPPNKMGKLGAKLGMR